jgi:hypothetical protein
MAAAGAIFGASALAGAQGLPAAGWSEGAYVPPGMGCGAAISCTAEDAPEPGTLSGRLEAGAERYATALRHDAAVAIAKVDLAPGSASAQPEHRVGTAVGGGGCGCPACCAIKRTAADPEARTETVQRAVAGAAGR